MIFAGIGALFQVGLLFDLVLFRVIVGSGSVARCGSSHFRRKYARNAQLLLDRGADPNARDDGGCTPLHYSSWWEEESFDPCHGTVEGSRLLLDYGADINAENNEGKTPLGVALDAGRHEMVDFLSSLGAK